MSDKERAKFAREHYRKNHEERELETPIKWTEQENLGHRTDTDIDPNTTIPFTIPTVTETFQYVLNETQQRRNLKLLWFILLKNIILDNMTWSSGEPEGVHT